MFAAHKHSLETSKRALILARQKALFIVIGRSVGITTVG
jgi:hypothetical protein